MLTKLTLTIDDSVISKAKSYAQSRNKSVSRIVEEYLAVVSDISPSIATNKKISSPITDSLVGMFNDPGQDYKKILEDALMEKHNA